MSENWGSYFADMGGYTASIVFDDGISSKINSIQLPMALRLKLSLREFREDGLPTSDEGKRISQLDEQINAAIVKAGGIYLGRVTVNGVRWVMSLVKQDCKDLVNELKLLAASAKYQMQVFTEEDQEKEIYWKDLYPTPDDRQVMLDMQVLDSLAQHGDDHILERPIHHWLICNSRQDAEKCAEKLDKKVFRDTKVEKISQGLLRKAKWCVLTTHIGTVLLNDITKHTIQLARLAKETGGEYDGWETPVMKIENKAVV